jgi:hypothetical protein
VKRDGGQDRLIGAVATASIVPKISESSKLPGGWREWRQSWATLVNPPRRIPHVGIDADQGREDAHQEADGENAALIDREQPVGGFAYGVVALKLL